MADNKKYYYMRLKENFFDSEEIKILESMPNGYKYSNILLKLYLKSLKGNGELRLNAYIPYDSNMIAAITGHDVDTVRVALDVLKKLKLVEILDNGTIYMLGIQSYIGKTTTEADRIRLYRAKIEEEKKQLQEPVPICTKSVQMYTRDKDRDKDKDRDRDKDRDKDKDRDRDKDNKISWKDILLSWNDLPSPIRPIKSITELRKNKIKARINSLKLKQEDIIKTINNIKQSQFLQGNNGKNWTIEFDWLFKNDTNFSKVFEGKYGDKKVVTATKKVDNFNNYEQRKYDYDDLEKKLLGWNEEGE